MANHAIYEVFQQQKHTLLLHLLANIKELNQVLVVVRERESVSQLSSLLANEGVSLETVHGKKKVSLINQALESLGQGKVRVLIATDASARNIELDEVLSVIHVDFPEIHEDYQARHERVREAGGVLFTFVSPQKKAALQALESGLELTIPRMLAEGFDYDAREVKEREKRNKTPKRGPRSKPLQHKKKKWKPKKYTR